ncbi:MAG: SIR2 family protein, partial [Bacteroidia bacterium]|nr:SIR2 family protein [Bacteroidia bacterium]
MKHELSRSIQSLRQAMLSNKLVVFAGAGISMDSEVPSWGGLIEAMKGDLDGLGKETDFLKIPQLYYNQRGHKEYYDKLRDVLQPGKQLPNGIHKAILDLEPEHIITTNFDDLLEKEANQQGRFYSVVKRDRDLPSAVSNRLIIKMHGDFQHENLVLKEDDFLEYERNFPLIERTVQGLFASRTILFVGISFSDYNLKFILQKVRNILDTSIRPAYFIAHETLSVVQKDYLSKKGIFAIEMTSDLEKEIDPHMTVDIGPKRVKGVGVIKALTLIKNFDRIVIAQQGGIWQKIKWELDLYADLNAVPLDAIYQFQSVKELTNNGFQLNIKSTELFNWLRHLQNWRSLKSRNELKIEYTERIATLKRAR